MPLHDNIADALPLVQDGEYHTVTLTTVGATEETNESSHVGYPFSVWLTFDLVDYLQGFFDGSGSEFNGGNVALDLSVVNTSNQSFLPYIKAMKVADAAWSPSAPDFSKLSTNGIGSFGGNPYLGDGTESPPSARVGFYGGSQVSTGSSLSAMSKTGVWYLLLADWDFAVEGTIELTYRITVEPIVIDATDDPGPGVTIDGDHLDEPTQAYDFSNVTGADWPSVTDTRVTTYVRGENLPPPGRYRVFAEVRSETSPGAAAAYITVRRNGLPYYPGKILGSGQRPTTPAVNTSTFVAREITDQTQRSRPSEYYGPYYVPVLAGDEFELSLWNDSGLTLELRRTKWIRVEEGGSPGAPIQLLELPDLPRGATTALNSPDLTRWGGSLNQNKQVCVTANGKVYMLWDEGKGGAQPNVSARLVTYDGASFTTLSDDPFDVGNLGGGAGVYYYYTGTGVPVFGAQPIIVAFSMDTDGEDVYVCFGKTDGTTTTNAFGVAQLNWRIHVRRWDVSAGSWVDMGSFRHVEPVTNNWGADCGSYDRGIPQVRCSPEGAVWVTYIMTDTSVPQRHPTDLISYERNLAAVHRWTLISTGPDVWDWVDTNLAAPTNPHTVAGGWNVPEDLKEVDCSAINVNVQRQVDIAFRNEVACVAFHAVYDLPNLVNPAVNPKSITSKWYYAENNWAGVGTPWSAFQKWSFSDWFDAAGKALNFHDNSALWWEPGEQWQQGMRLADDGNGGVFLAAALGFGGSGVNPVLVLKQDGSNWKPLPLLRIPGTGADREAGMWVDPTGCDMCVDKDGNVWLIIGSSEFSGSGGLMVINPSETGTGDGGAYASLTNNGIGLYNDIGSYDRIYCPRAGTTVYGLATSNNGNFSVSNIPTLWVMPRNGVHVPWTPGSFDAVSMNWRSDARHAAGVHRVMA